MARSDPTRGRAQPWFRSRRAFLGEAACATFSAAALRHLPAGWWTRRSDGNGAVGELALLVRWVRELAPERLTRELVDRIRDGLTPESLLRALLHAGLADVRPQPVGFQFHCVLQLPAVWGGVAKSPVTPDSWLPLGYALHQYLLLKARAKPGGGLPVAPEPAVLPSAPTAAAELDRALREFDLEAGDAAVTALVRGGDRVALRRTLLPFAARNFTDVGHHPIFAAGAVELLEAFGWDDAEPLLRSLVRGLLLPGPSEACDDFARSREIAAAIAAREHEWIDPELLAALRLGPAAAPDARFDLSTLPASPAAAQAALLAWLARSGGEASQFFSGFAAVIDLALELLAENRGLLAVHALTSTAALYELAAGQDVAERWTTLLQAAAWLPRWRAAFGGARVKSRTESPLLDDFIQDLGAAGAVGATGAAAATFLELRGDDRRSGALAVARAIVADDAGDGSIAFWRAGRSRLVAKGREAHDWKYFHALQRMAFLPGYFEGRRGAARQAWLHYNSRTGDEADFAPVAELRQALGG